MSSLFQWLLKLQRETFSGLGKQMAEGVILQLFSKVANLLGTAWAARCLGPASLGVSGILLNLLSPALLLSTQSHDPLLIRTHRLLEDSPSRMRLVGVVFLWRLSISFLLVGIAFILFSTHLHSPLWSHGIWATAALMILNTILPTWLLIAQERMVIVYRSLALNALSVTLIYLIFFRPGQATGSDLIAMTCGSLIANCYAWSKLSLPSMDWSFLSHYLEYLKNGKWLFFQGLLYHSYTSLDLILVGSYCSLEEAGLYRTAILIAMSAQQLAGMIPNLIYPRMVDWMKENRLSALHRLHRLAILLLVVAIIAGGLSALLAPSLYPLLFGGKFEGAALPFTILLTAKLIAIAGSFYTCGLLAESRDRDLVLKILLPAGVASVLLNLFLIPRGGMMAASLINLTTEILIGLRAYQIIRHHGKNATSSQPPLTPSF